MLPPITADDKVIVITLATVIVTAIVTVNGTVSGHTEMTAIHAAPTAVALVVVVVEVTVSALHFDPVCVLLC